MKYISYFIIMKVYLLYIMIGESLRLPTGTEYYILLNNNYRIAYFFKQNTYSYVSLCIIKLLTFHIYI